jgi:hypothetical protein
MPNYFVDLFQFTFFNTVYFSLFFLNTVYFSLFQFISVYFTVNCIYKEAGISDPKYNFNANRTRRAYALFVTSPSACVLHLHALFSQCHCLALSMSCLARC